MSKRIPLSKLLELDGALTSALHDTEGRWLNDARVHALRRELCNARAVLRVYFDVPVEIEVKDDSEVAA